MAMKSVTQLSRKPSIPKVWNGALYSASGCDQQDETDLTNHVFGFRIIAL